MSSIFEGSLSTPEMLDAFSERQVLAAMLRFEAALARAQANAGLIPQAAAQSIIGTCKIELFDVEKVVRESGRSDGIATPLIKALKETVGIFNQSAAPFVHYGATGQDAIDTAMALVTRDALQLIESDLLKAAARLLVLAETHADQAVLARAQLQPAAITSFGLQCADWAAPLVRGVQRLRATAAKALSVQLGGAGGSFPQTQHRGQNLELHVAMLMAADLGLRVPGHAWHTQRDEWVALGCELGVVVGSLGKIAKDVSLMSQYEVGEVGESDGSDRSSAMLHPRSAGGCRVALAAAQRAPHRVAALLSAMPQEHERGLGNWEAEVAEWPGLVMSAHGAARAMSQVVSGLTVDTQRMQANLDAYRATVSGVAAGNRFNPALTFQAVELARAQVMALADALAELQPLEARTPLKLAV